MWWPEHERPTSGPRPDKGEAEVLCDEVAAFVTGRSAELFAERGDVVPSWAWLNAAAHRNAERIHALARQLATGAARRQGWDSVAVTVAASLVALSDGSASAMAQLQLERLVPLELALASGRARARSAGELVHLALLALHTGRWPCAA